MTLVMFGAAWCGPCKRTRPVAERVAAEVGVPFEYVDIDTGDPRAANLLSIPVLRLYDAAGQVLAELVGGSSESQIRALLT